MLKKTKMFTITGDNKEVASQGKEKLLELIRAVCERPRVNVAYVWLLNIIFNIF